MFATVSMNKHIKIKNIEYGIKQVNRLYLQRGFKITRINDDSEFGPLYAEMSDLGIYLNLESKKKHISDIVLFNRTVKQCFKYNQADMNFI